MIAAAAAALADGRAAELAAPDDQRVVEQARPLQVGQQGGDRLVGHPAHLFVVGVDVVVRIPLHGDRAAARIELDEPDAALDQPARQQAPRAELDGPRIVQAVERPWSTPDSRDRSTASGAALCIRKASS